MLVAWRQVSVCSVDDEEGEKDVKNDLKLEMTTL